MSADGEAPLAASASDADGRVDGTPHVTRYDMSRALWGRLGERFGAVALRPRMAKDTRVRRVGDEVELVHLSTGNVVPLDEDDVRIVRLFDGERSVAEMIVHELESERRLAIQPVLELVDRVARAGMIVNFPPNMFAQLDAHLAGQAAATAAFRRSEQDMELEAQARERERLGAPGEIPDGERTMSQFSQVPWRPRTPLLAERAQFLRTVELLKPLDAWAIGALAEAANEEAHPAASNIIREGQIAERFYIVRSGDVNVTKLGEDGVSRRIAKLGPGDYFGETGLLDAGQRSATVRVGPSVPAQLYTFPADVFERIISPHISAFRGRQLISKRRARLEQIPLFADLGHDEVESLARAVKELRAPSGTTVCTQGDEGDRFYIIVEGAVGVVRDGVPVAKLAEGEFFGETALLFTSERTASVITTEDSLFWSIDKTAFQRMVREHLLHRRDMMPTVLNRLNR